ncbi:rna-directed rna polymerase [Stylonychia lemnae]|uniref:RNA-dependent RNA polymerase n=1 Tax=Stylonychia lemnae TaxID=5949 RepID=A0A078A464_STYLE|nr:rna-directed rna polymerase [Stylonychia lemnae]|eukprot:CDW77053.1 rna-directed rna polymerase [Stylonychia lemnae]
MENSNPNKYNTKESPQPRMKRSRSYCKVYSPVANHQIQLIPQIGTENLVPPLVFSPGKTDEANLKLLSPKDNSATMYTKPHVDNQQQRQIDTSSNNEKEKNTKYMFDIVSDIIHFQVGTIMYTKIKSDHQKENKKRFIPIFPFLYEDTNQGHNVNNCQFQMPNPPKAFINNGNANFISSEITNDNYADLKNEINQQKQEEEKKNSKIPTSDIPFKCQLRFQVEKDPFFMHEESRSTKIKAHKKILESENPSPIYIVDLEFTNIKKIEIFLKEKKLQGGLYAEIYVHMDKPANCQKLYPFNQMKPCFVRSPFKLPFDPYMQYWNLHQIYFIAGKVTNQKIDKFLEIVQKRNALVKVKITKQDYSEETNNDAKRSIIVSGLRTLIELNKKFKYIIDKLRLPIIFSMMAMLSNDKVNLFNEKFLEFIEFLQISDYNRTEDQAQLASFLIDKMIIGEKFDYKKQSDINYVTVFQRYREDKENENDFCRSKQSINFLRQRRLFISPTIDYYQPAQEDESNRVIRKYQDYLSRFVRVSFVNEYLEKGFYFTENMEWVLGYIHHVLYNGLQLGKYILRFLSYSNSQIKNHSCWMIVETLDSITEFNTQLNENMIMSSMGNFSKEQNILKRYARRGQCFSTTKFIVNLDKHEAQLGIPDIKRNGFVFTDGCGYISPQLAQIVSEQFGYKRNSAFQIRFGGAKGVLMIKPELKGRMVQIRDSQIKFQSNDFGLNVVRCSTFSQGFLNRQIIILLSSLGVKEEVFLSLQQKAKEYAQVQEIYKSLINKTKKAIKAYKQSHNKNRSLPQISQLINLSLGPSKWFEQTLKMALLTGYNIPKDPIFSSILYTMQLSSYMNLKKKARIIIPNSCVLLGVIDETGILEENEVYCQIRPDNYSLKRKQALWDLYSDDSVEEPKLVNGSVIVTRNPCTHPGDIRLLAAVDRPELAHLFNVIVFSSKGDRPQCNKMAGGDLDGDVYFVCWDKMLLDNIDPNNIEEPAKYEKPQLITEQPADTSHIADYYIFYLQRDVLGKLANMHLALCDQIGVDGPLRPECEELSAMQAVAVDFAKHGECVPKQNFEHLSKLLDDWPDFFEKSNQKARVSQGILGKLYRDINNESAIRDFMKNQFKFQVLFQYELNHQILQKCSNFKLLNHYLPKVFKSIVKPMEVQFRQLMITFKLQSEAQLFACDLKFKLCDEQMNNFYKNEPGYKSEESLIILNNKISQIITKFQEKFKSLVNEARNEKFDMQAEENIAVALYLCTYFHTNNQSCKVYLSQHIDDQNLMEFVTLWNNYEKERRSDLKPSYIEKYKKFEGFVEISRQVESSNESRKLQRFLELRKFFSFPWIIASDVLFSQRDFQIHIYKQKHQSQEQ